MISHSNKKCIEILICGVFFLTFTTSFNLKKEEIISQENCDKYSLSKINLNEIVYDIEILKELTREEALSSLASNNPKQSIFILEKFLQFLEKEMDTTFPKNKKRTDNVNVDTKDNNDNIDLDNLINNEQEKEEKEKETDTYEKELPSVPSQRKNQTELETKIIQEINKNVNDSKIENSKSTPSSTSTSSSSSTSTTTPSNSGTINSKITATITPNIIQKILNSLKANQREKVKEENIQKSFIESKIFKNTNEVTKEDDQINQEEIIKEQQQPISLPDKLKTQDKFIEDRNLDGEVWKFIGKIEDSVIPKTAARYQFAQLKILNLSGEEEEFVDLVSPLENKPVIIKDVYYENLSENNSEEDANARKSNSFSGESYSEFILVSYDNEVIEESTESRICVKGKKIKTIEEGVEVELFVRSNFIFVEKRKIKSCRTGDWKFNKVMGPLISEDGIYYKEMLDCYCTIMRKYS